MIKNVIFDLGDVLINNNPYEYIKKLGYSDEKTKALYQALSIDPVWHDKDVGIYNISNIRVAKELGINAVLFTDAQEALRLLG